MCPLPRLRTLPRFFYGTGRLLSEVCCTAMVYSADKKQTKIEFPEARLWEENMNVLLHEAGCEGVPVVARPMMGDESAFQIPRARALSTARASLPAVMALTDTI